MKKLISLSLLLCLALPAQTINPNQIRPGTAGQVLTTDMNGKVGFLPAVGGPPAAGSAFTGLDYNACGPASSNSFTCLKPWALSSTVTHRFNFNDFVTGLEIDTWHQHGGSNFLGTDSYLYDGTVAGNFMNTSGLIVNTSANTDVQGGGNISINTDHYGHGDAVMFTGYNRVSGESRPTDEGNEIFRIFGEQHGNLWGITIATMSTDANGQGLFQPSYSTGNGAPTQLTNHDTRASNDTGVIIDTSKVISGGNATIIQGCPGGEGGLPINPSFYTCVTLDTAPWGMSTMTTLQYDISDSPVAGVDPFVNSPVCQDATTSGGVLSAGDVISMSAAGDNYEQVTVLAASGTTFHACFSRPHVSGELISKGGGVGYALSAAVDDIAPHQLLGVDNDNVSTLHVAFPIVATLAGNVQVIWTDAATTFGGSEMRTRALQSNYPNAAGSFTPVLTGTALSAITVNSAGNYFTQNSNASTGSTILPPPTISFAGSTCTTLPVAHFVYVYTNNSQQTPSPVIDSVGNCSALAMAVQSVWTNPINLYPMVYARSNKDPNFSTHTTCTGCAAYLQSQGISASTDGYLAAGSSNPSFAVGDDIEMGVWWQHYTSSQMSLYNSMPRSGKNGDWWNTRCSGITNNACFAVINGTPPARYYGDAAHGWQPDSSGNGQDRAPVGLALRGPVGTGVAMDLPRNGSGSLGATGVILQALCAGIAGTPCQAGIFNPTTILLVQGSHGYLSGTYDPNAETLTWQVSSAYLVTHYQGLQSDYIQFNGSTNGPPTCNVSRRGQSYFQEGYDYVADKILYCFRTATPDGSGGFLYAWQ